MNYYKIVPFIITLVVFSTSCSTFSEKEKNNESKIEKQVDITDPLASWNDVASKNNILTEVFIHGSYCISFSGICYMSSVHGGNSGNRGRCSQPCRDRYLTTQAGKNFPLNLKDNSASVHD